MYFPNRYREARLFNIRVVGVPHVHGHYLVMSSGPAHQSFHRILESPGVLLRDNIFRLTIGQRKIWRRSPLVWGLFAYVAASGPRIISSSYCWICWRSWRDLLGTRGRQPGLYRAMVCHAQAVVVFFCSLLCIRMPEPPKGFGDVSFVFPHFQLHGAGKGREIQDNIWPFH